MYAKCACNKCSSNIEFDVSYAGEIVLCPHCQAETQLVIPDLASPPQVEGPDIGNKKAKRDWKNDPATPKQLNYLESFGYVPDRPLTKGEASNLIDQFSEDPERLRTQNQKWVQEREQAAKEGEREAAFRLHKECERAAQDLATARKVDIRDAKQFFNDCRKERLGFWKDTFRQDDRQIETLQTIDLYYDYGHRFKVPTSQQIQAVLDALDAHSPMWDKNTPAAFYHTLKENFPDLLRKN